VWAISLTQGREFQAQSMTDLYMPDDCLGSDLSFLDKKFKLGLCAHDRWLSRLDKQTPDAQIPNSRSVITSITPPVNPDATRCVDPRVESP
jgi:hypothetical protein